MARAIGGGRGGRNAALVVLAALVVFALWRSRRAPQPARARVDRDAAESPATREGSPTSPAVPAGSPVAPAGRPPPTPDPPPVIDEILVEKPEVCSGEEDLISVRAHTLNGTDAFLHYAIDGQMGSSVPLRMWGGDHRQQHVVQVFGRTNTPVTAAIPEIRIKDCQPEWIAALQHRLRPNSWSDFEFLAKVVHAPRSDGPNSREPRPNEPNGFEATSYRWSFGDGSSLTTRSSSATHDYEGRSQDALYSYFVVRVEVSSRGGAKVEARTTLPLLNPAFESFERKGIVQLLVAFDPRFPALEDDGRVIQHVRLWHIRPEPVTIENAVKIRYFESGSGETTPEPVDVVGLLGASTIPAGREGLTTSVVLDTLTDPGVVSITYRLTGHTPDGHVAMGTFSVMRPPARPTPSNSQPVEDPALRSRIVAARAILGKDVVSDEDLWSLERQGAFSATGAAPAPSGTPIAAVRGSAPSLRDPSIPIMGPPVPTGVTPPPAATIAPAAGASSK